MFFYHFLKGNNIFTFFIHFFVYLIFKSTFEFMEPMLSPANSMIKLKLGCIKVYIKEVSVSFLISKWGAKISGEYKV